MSVLERLSRRMCAWMLHLLPGMPTCREIDSYLGDDLDGERPDGQRRRFERHLHVCAPCQRCLR